MRLLSIASGSSGNSIYVGSDNTHILIDTGISKKRIEEGLSDAGLSGADIDGICITHEHSDHICSLGIMSRKYGIPVYATADTIEAIKKDISLGDFSHELFVPISGDKEFRIGDLNIMPFKIHHDAADPVGYRIENGSKAVAVATDMGHYDNYIISKLKNLDALLVEANHDIRMLEAGPYPYALKRRILSDTGHLSNENCGKLLCEILNSNMRKVFLGHLSKENNIPELALEAVKCEIAMGPCPYVPNEFDISVAGRSKPSELIEFT